MDLVWVVSSDEKVIGRVTNLYNIVGLDTGVTGHIAHPNGISYADGFRYYVDGFLCWMLLGGLKRRKFH